MTGQSRVKMALKSWILPSKYRRLRWI